MKFQATILVSGKTATGIRAPTEVVEGLGPSRRIVRGWRGQVPPALTTCPPAGRLTAMRLGHVNGYIVDALSGAPQQSA